MRRIFGLLVYVSAGSRRREDFAEFRGCKSLLLNYGRPMFQDTLRSRCRVFILLRCRHLRLMV